ncbi:hypothetical protein Tsubulata_008109 [Turnera subulata]|uniref:Uncharacterized protein n=1 Tax=Turnera subulata TaxID=218843 RepID=A0A9Q0G4R0_9ROSI|nr:hypothetical protein Tsubulata_008109 [Turnera subulata]
MLAHLKLDIIAVRAGVKTIFHVIGTVTLYTVSLTIGGGDMVSPHLYSPLKSPRISISG